MKSTVERGPDGIIYKPGSWLQIPDIDLLSFLFGE